MKKPTEKLMTVNALSDATGTDRRTCRKRLAEAGMLTGRSSWNLAEVLPFILAGRPSKSLEVARLRLITEQARKIKTEGDLAEAKLQILLKNWFPKEAVERLWNGTLILLRNKVSESEMPQQLKIDILKDLKAVAASAEYLADAPAEMQEGSLQPADEG